MIEKQYYASAKVPGTNGSISRKVITAFLPLEAARKMAEHCSIDPNEVFFDYDAGIPVVHVFRVVDQPVKIYLEEIVSNQHYLAT